MTLVQRAASSTKICVAAPSSQDLCAMTSFGGREQMLGAFALDAEV